MTQVWRAEPAGAGHQEAVEAAARLLKEGGRVAFPTETVYGLGADARSTEAVEGIFAAKGRPSDNPLIVHIADRAQLGEIVAGVDELSARLMDAFWPGPLTLVLPVKPGALSPRVTAGLATVGVRMPDHPLALALIRVAGCPVAAPSANRSGRPSPTRAEHVLDDLNGVIEGVLDGGPTGVGVESTVVEAAGGAVHVLRPGGVSAEALERFAPVAGAGPDGEPGAPGGEDALHAPKAPGMKYAHYAPRGRLAVVQGPSPEAVSSWIRQELARAKAAGERTGVLACAEHAARYDADAVIACGRLGDPGSAARGLYDALRGFDEAGVTFILAEAVEESGIGAAVMNRLRKAAGGRVIRL
ncbi:L-threonylcarbamoyladenylate synthase [Paenibacillus aurantius]|uniref:Threonylcarbamoyl-AMP synthase n=1 Tax=Paenibacillus aurantius TaxID=2918900 RepID=A0AA96LE51_9BACL|nr:L-threonylcarbamoyladenylate synthase [Paenibacillus aurantius]WNQ11539.1 L-threonylcarbamoyladenylate synthase [Paenibacillus aurantius]